MAKYGGRPPFEETQNYVKKVTAYMEEYKQETETVSVSNVGVSVLEAYERMKEETYWKVLK